MVNEKEVKKERLKRRLVSLIREEEAVKQKMRELVRDYLISEGRLARGMTAEDIAYKKIIREEFGLVI